MNNWWQRSEQRRRELAQGVDADLVQANRKRFWTSLCLIGIAGIVGVIDSRLNLPRALHLILRCAAVVFGLVGIVMAKWAQHEHEFLTSPDPEKPPTVFKE
jgi:UDP-N-acetylmuramyl pentapeptide phosphotransferase/UDP-N-acetylglucosamine-1-phosphate transferase